MDVACLRWLAALLVVLVALPAQAANYVFPGALPAACSGVGPSYTCTSLTLAWGDTITIDVPKPATITINGNLDTNNAQINLGGTSADLNIMVSGTLVTGYQARINANVVAGTVSSTGTEVTFGGSVTATSGNVTLAYKTSVGGSVTSTGGGAISIANESAITGSVGSSGGGVSIGQKTTVGGGVSSANGAITIDNEAVISGNLSSTNGAVSLLYRSRVVGDIATGSTITLANETQASGCVRTSLSSANAITLNYQSNAAGVCCGAVCNTACVNNQSTYAMPPTCSVTQYRMDEAAGSWNGTVGEVRDSGGTGLHGRLMVPPSPPTSNVITPAPTIKSQYPAVNGDFCNAAQFDGTTYVQVPKSPNFNYTTQLSATAWVYPTAYPSGGNLYSILSNDENYEFHINSAGRLYWWWNYSTLTSATVIPLNTWTHVAITFDSSAGVRRQRIYINGVADANTNNWQGTLRTNQCDFYLGGDVATGPCTVISDRNFRGRIDEAKLYNRELTAAQVQSDMLAGRQCAPTGTLDHIRLEHDGAAATCAPETVTVKACADASCTSLFTGNVSTTLSPAGWIGGNTISFAGGSTTRQLSVSTAGNVTLGAAGTSPTPAVATRCFNGASETCTLNFSSSSCGGFDAVEVSADPRTRIFTKLASTAFTLDIVAVRTNGTVNTGYRGTLDVDLVDASTAACTNASIAGLNTVQSHQIRNSDNGRRPLTFSNFANAAANVRVRIREGGSSITCSTDSFTIRPTAFTSVTSSANANSAGTNSTATPSVKAGAAFSLSADTNKPGYNGSPKADPAQLEWTNAPTGGRPAPGTGNLDGATAGNLSFGTAASSATGNGASGNFTYDEVGYFRFRVNGIYDNTFAAASGDVAGSDCIVGSFSNTLDASGKYGCSFGNTGASNHFGRFTPNHFDTAVTQACAAGNFTYAGQLIPLSISARNLAGGTAVNFSGAFAKQITLTARDSADTITNPGPGAFASDTVLPGLFTGGVASPTPTYTFNSPQTAPSEVRVRALDTDGVSSLRTAPAVTVEGVARLRSGRARLGNAYGSELLDLPVPFRTEYWAGASGWAVNSADTCTDATLSFAQVGATNITGSTCVIEPGNVSGKGCAVAPAVANRKYLESGVTGTDSNGVAGFAGNFNLWLRAPGSGNAGTIRVDAVVPSWLQFNWTGTVGNPSARATFGVYRSGPIIHRREMY